MLCSASGGAEGAGASVCRGNIYIDGVDILRMGLRDLRSRLALVPQEPVMFSGTIRSNLDPTGLCPDDKMLNALRQVTQPARLCIPLTIAKSVD